MNKIYLENDESTNKLGALISERLKEINKSTIEIHLEGDLGAGKTFLTRSIISNSGWSGLVKSPTYTLCEEYDLGDMIFLHIDLYRTDEPEDIHIFNLDRKTHLKISLEHFEDGRKVSINDNNELFSSLIKHYE